MLNSTNKQKKNRSRESCRRRSKRIIQVNDQCCIRRYNGNLRNKIETRLVSNKKDYLKWTSKPSYISQKMFGTNLVAIRKNKVTLTFNKPAYIGMCILELGKVLIYEYHYDYIKNKCGNNPRLLFKDTDSLVYEIKIKNSNEDFSSNKEILDCTNHSTNSK